MYGYTTTTNLGGEFKLAAVSEKIIEMLVKTKLDKIFAKYASVEEALKSWDNQTLHKFKLYKSTFAFHGVTK